MKVFYDVFVDVFAALAVERVVMWNYVLMYGVAALQCVKHDLVRHTKLARHVFNARCHKSHLDCIGW